MIPPFVLRPGWSRVVLSVCLLAPTLAACAAPPLPPVCRSAVVDALSLRVFRGHPVVTVTVNGEPVNMLLDTGAESSVLTRATALRLHLTPDRASRAVVTGIDGTRLQDVARATVALTGRGRLLVLPVVDLPGEMELLAGVVGTDVLSDYDLDLDQPGGQVTLRRAEGCTANDAPWPGRSVRLPAAFTTRQRVLVSVGLGPVEVQALLDTGISDSVVSLDTVHRAGVSDGQVAAGTPFLFLGAALQPITMHTVHLDDVRIGPDHVGGMPVAVPQAALPGVNMLLGNDYLSRRRMLISWSRQAVFVQTGR